MRSLLVAPCVLVLALNVVRATDRWHQATPASQTKKDSCVDEQALAFSNGSLRKVAGQIQKCEAGVWVIDDMNGPKDPALEKAKPCVGVKEQQYAPAVLRQVKDKVERCHDGKWIEVRAAPHPQPRILGSSVSHRRSLPIRRF